jgi:cobalt/nickel transport system permease protein
MHIPDGFISVPVAGATGLVSAVALVVACGRSQEDLGMRRAPILGLTTAFIFAAQMINFPVAGGISGHLLGGTLAAVILGSPWAGIISIATVFIIQAVLFADGGITALGANILNVGVIAVGVGWVLTQTLHRLFGGSKQRLPLAAGMAAAISVVVAAIACSLQLAISGTAQLAVILPPMIGVHILIGVGEGLVTGGVLAYLGKARPDLLPEEQQKFQGWLVPVVSICLIAGVLSLAASSWPDGLERVAEDLGFIDLAAEVRVEIPTPFADYENESLGMISTSIAGLLGSVVSFGAAFAIAQVVKPKNA